MPKTLEAHDKLVCEIFGGSYQFEIPDYQRPYAWKVEHAVQLFDDLFEEMQKWRDLGDEGQYFLGSIVLIKQDRETKSAVVDGQQRLSTLTMLFAVLRTVMPEAARDITSFLYHEGQISLGGKNEYRMTAREKDADFFRTYVQEVGGIEKLINNKDKLKDSQLCYRKNAIALLTKAQALTPSELSAFWIFLATQCSLVVISSSDFDAAYRIFSVLNNRGLDLAPLDIVKADVLGQIHLMVNKDKSHEYAKTWSDIERGLGRDAFGDLIGHIRSVYAMRKQKFTLVKDFQTYVTEYKTPTVLIDDVIKPYAEVWEFVRDANFEATEHAETINEHLSWLNRVEFNDWVPPALIYFKRFRQQPNLLSEFVDALEGLTFFLLVTKAGVNVRIETYAGLIKQIGLDTFNGDIASLTELHLSDLQKKKFVAALDGNVYSELPRARMVLVLRLESLIRDPGVRLESAVSLEHVLPQKPPDGSDWLLWFPNAEERETWTHRLANLVPLNKSKNSAASNYDFAKKKDTYFRGSGTASPYMLTQEVRAEADWTPAHLAKRQERLVGVLKNHWNLAVTTSTAA